MREVVETKSKYLCERSCKIERWSVVSYLYFENCHWNKEHAGLKKLYIELFEKIIKNFQLFEKVMRNLKSWSKDTRNEQREFSSEELFDMLEFSLNRVQSLLSKM